MIKDPIRLPDYPDNRFLTKCREDGITDLFYRMEVGYGPNKIDVIALMDVIRSTHFNYKFRFAVVTMEGLMYRLDGPIIGKEEFITTMMDLYPDHFEWFLFHPEFLP